MARNKIRLVIARLKEELVELETSLRRALALAARALANKRWAMSEEQVGDARLEPVKVPSEVVEVLPPGSLPVPNVRDGELPAPETAPEGEPGALSAVPSNRPRRPR
jgi:hypothetical protein